MAGCPKKRPTARTAWAGRGYFIVDPLDGTRAYLDGQDGFAHPVCLVEDGRPIAAAIHLPRLGQTYSAALGQGAFCNAAPIHVAMPADVPRVLAARSQLEAGFWPGGAPMAERFFRPRPLRGAWRWLRMGLSMRC